MTGDTSPPPFLHITDIYLDYNSDSDTVRLMSANLGCIASVTLLKIHHPLHGVAKLLPQCPKLSGLCIGYMSNVENLDLLVPVIPRLTQLTTVRYDGILSDAADRAVVAAVMSLTQLVQIRLENVRLGDGGLDGTDAMTRLRTVLLLNVRMSATGWDRFVSSLLALPQSVCVELSYTDIDEGTVRRVQTSNRITVTRDDGKRDERGRYVRLEFTTVSSQTA